MNGHQQLCTGLLQALGVHDRNVTKAVIVFDAGCIKLRLTKWVPGDPAALASSGLPLVTKTYDVVALERSVTR
jgi:hypothetical protein